MKHTVMALALPLLAACATIQPASPPGGACRNDSLQQFVGQPATAALGTRMLAASGAKTLQWVAAGMMVTMDYREDRVRAYLDEQNKLSRVSCG